MIRAQGHCITNLKELKQYADIWHIYNQLDQFIEFAAIHCVPLELLLDHDAAAVCLRKEFWMDILRKHDEIENACLDGEATVEKCTEMLCDRGIAFITMHADDTVSLKDARESLREEWIQLRISEKLSFLLDEVRANNEKPYSAVILTAICMLAEMEPTARTGSGDEFRTRQEEEGGPAAAELLKAGRLECRRPPYRFMLYEEESLRADEVIETMKLEAVRGDDGFDHACIQVFSEKDQETVWEFVMRPGEYRHCNTVGGKIVCFLPTLAICDTACICRPHYYSGDLLVQYRDDREDVCLEYGTDISGFSVGEDGELYLRKGRALAGRYLPARRQCAIADMLDTYSYKTFVEVQIIKGGFLLLDSKGRIWSNLPEWNGRNAVSFCQAAWLKQRIAGARYQAKEYCLDEDGGNMIIHASDDDACKIRWA